MKTNDLGQGVLGRDGFGPRCPITPAIRRTKNWRQRVGKNYYCGSVYDCVSSASVKFLDILN